jgi:hypothetical protein
MINQETVKQIKQAPVSDRIQLIEIIVKSLKNDIKTVSNKRKPKPKLFKVRKFDIGQEIQADRDMMYTERNI